MTHLDVRLLGGFQARLGVGLPLALPAKAQALLAYLALRPGAAHPRDKIAALLWGATSDAQARANLRHTVFTLRKAVGETALQTDGHTLAVEPNAVDVDASTFERLVDDGSPEALERASALYRGDLLDGLALAEPPFEEWLLAERERLRERAAEALTKLLAHQMREPATERAIRTAMRLLALEPLQEAVHRTLMRLYARQARRGAALRQYQICLSVLQRELGAEPEAETKQLYQEILRRRAPESAPAVPEPAATRQSRRMVGAVAPALPAHDTALIGRDSEVADITAALDSVFAGRGRVAVVLGEAGVGKTRITAEAASLALARGASVLAGRCYESAGILPFGPWADALRGGDVLAETHVLDGLHDVLRGELPRLFPELGVRRAHGATGGLDHLRLFEALTQIFVVLASERPVVVVLEDLHWADEMSLRFLSFLARRMSTLPILVVATAREEELADAPALARTLNELRRDPETRELALARLSREATASLVRSLARAGRDALLGGDVEDQVWRSSEGNPFIAVETLRALEQGTALSGGSFALPERVQELVTNRLARLRPPVRELATVAAVIGREFDFALLQRAGGLGERETAEAVEELVRRRVLHGVGERLSFTHDWIRRTAYDGLLAPTRQVLHGVVARAVEELHAGRLEEVYDVLAFHYALTEHAGKAIDYLARLAEQATRAYAHTEALTALDEALACVARLAPENRERARIELLVLKAECLHVLGRVREVLEALVAEGDLLDRLQEPRLAGRYHLRLGYTHSVLGNRSEAALHARQAIGAASLCGDRATLGRAHYVLAVESFFTGRLTEGAQEGREAIKILEEIQDLEWLGLAYWITGYLQFWLGDLDPAIASATNALAIGETIEHSRIRSFAGWTVGLVHAVRGDWEQSLRACQAALDVARDPVSLAHATAWLGCVHLWRGDALPAIPLLEQAVEAVQTFGHRPAKAFYLSAMADAYLLVGNPGKAGELATESLHLARETSFPPGIGSSSLSLGRVARATGNFVEAEAHFSEALDTAQALGARHEVAYTHLALAELAHARNVPSTAVVHLRQAYALGAGLRARRHIERCKALAAALDVALDPGVSLHGGCRA